MKGRNLITGLPDEIEIINRRNKRSIEEPVALIVETCKISIRKNTTRISSRYNRKRNINDWWRSIN